MQAPQAPHAHHTNTAQATQEDGQPDLKGKQCMCDELISRRCREDVELAFEVRFGGLRARTERHGLALPEVA
jgi:hypothetical protein